MRTAIQALSDETIRHYAPSVFATEAKQGASERYTFLPTSSILDGMRSEGWVPVEVQEQGVRATNVERRGYQKHMLRFARQTDLERFEAQLEPGKHVINYRAPLATRMDVIITNSHDRTSGYQLYGSPYRLVCFNGLVISDAAMQHLSIPHIGFSPSRVIEATLGMAREMPLVMETIAGWQDRVMTEAERDELAKQALQLRWDDVAKAPIRAARLLEARRYADKGNDLWRTWNVVQENLLKGGMHDTDRRREARLSDLRAPSAPREVVAINERIRINRSLWDLAENFAQN